MSTRWRLRAPPAGAAAVGVGAVLVLVTLLGLAAYGQQLQADEIDVTVTPIRIIVGQAVSVTAALDDGLYWHDSTVSFELVDQGGTVRATASVSGVAGTIDDVETTMSVPATAPSGVYSARVCGVVDDLHVILRFASADSVTTLSHAVRSVCSTSTFQVDPIRVILNASDTLVGVPLDAVAVSNTDVGFRIALVGPGYLSPIQVGTLSADVPVAFRFSTTGLTPGHYQVQGCHLTGSTNTCTPGTYAADVVLNCRPNAVNRSLATNPGQPVSVTTGTLLGPECAPVGAEPQVVSQPASGTATADPAGVTYTPAVGFAGTDSFPIQVCITRPQVCSQTAQVTVTVNAPPVAANTTLSVVSNGTVSFDVRDFSSDSDGTVTRWQATVSPGFGSLTNSGATTGTYTAPGGRCGDSTTFTFVVFDQADAESNPATARVNIVGCPTATDFEFEAVAGLVVGFTVEGTDPDGELVSWEIASPPEAGEVTRTEGLDGEYLAPEGACGEQATFSFRVIDDDGSVSGPATATARIVGCPLLRADTVEDGAGGFSVIDVLANDEFPGGVDLESLRVVTPPSQGQAAVADGRITYRADADFVGIDEFTYEACDVHAQCGTAQVSIEVSFRCDAPSEGTVTIEPATASPGDEVEVTVELPADDVDDRCETLVVLLVLQGSPWGGPLTLDRIGGEAFAGRTMGIDLSWVFAQSDGDSFVGTAVRTVPADIGPGEYRVDLTDAGTGGGLGTGTLTIPEASGGEGLIEGEGDGGIPGAVWGAAAGLAAAAGGAVWFAGRRRRDHLGDPCPGERRRLTDGREEVEAARARLEAAETRLGDARSTLAGLESELAGCAEQQRGAAAGLPFGRPGAADDGPEITEYRLTAISNPFAPPALGVVHGWWSTRTQAIDSILLCDLAQVGLDPRGTTESIITDVGSLSTNFAAHILVTADAITGLLPDEMAVAGVGRPSALVAVLSDPDDAAVRAGAARVVGRWRRRYGLPEDAVSAGVVDGHRSSVDVASVLSATGDSARSTLGAVVPLAGRGAEDPCAGIRTQVEEQRAEVESVRAEVEEHRAELHAAEARAEEATESLRECECRPAAVAGHPEEAVPEDDTTESRWFLLKHPNPNAPVRTNNKRGWYHPTRQQPISGIVVHTAEALNGPGTAMYLSTVDRPASAHVIADATGIIKLLPDSYTAFHAAGGNGRGLGIEIEYYADNWGSNPTLEEALLRTASAWCGMKAAAYGIPAVRLTAEEWAAGSRGFVAHGDLDPSRRRDPGRQFPWDDFLQRVATFTGTGVDSP
jgi:hypothetical protein